ncbi:hypothetical protein [Arcticibacter pallidicorallinus]|uniref:hypothetical protein n=1 Tax=Arcticibacter pallidicorallinus TaxID=1259464 RepID=UPI003CCB7C7B
MLYVFPGDPQQNEKGLLDVEFQDQKGTPGIRISFDEQGLFRLKAGYRNKTLLNYHSGTRYEIVVDLDAHMYTVTVNGEKMSENTFFAPLDHVARFLSEPEIPHVSRPRYAYGSEVRSSRSRVKNRPCDFSSSIL